MKTLFKSLLLLTALLLCACATAKNPPSTVQRVNLQRYMGRWYEIASFPNFFQRRCRCTVAQYRLEKGKVRIKNSCYRGKKMKLKIANGKAWAVKGSYNSKLKIQFFWPFRGDYWILYNNYRVALVGSPKRNYLWILARKPKIAKSTYNRMVRIARAKGFDVSKLKKTRQWGCPGRK